LAALAGRRDAMRPVIEASSDDPALSRYLRLICIMKGLLRLCSIAMSNHDPAISAPVAARFACKSSNEPVYYARPVQRSTRYPPQERTERLTSSILITVLVRRTSAGRPGAIHSPSTRHVCSIRISSAMLVFGSCPSSAN